MKINEILKEDEQTTDAPEVPAKPPLGQRLKTAGASAGKGVLSGIGSFLGGAIGGAASGMGHAMKNAPSSLSANSKLVVNPNDVKDTANIKSLFKLPGGQPAPTTGQPATVPTVQPIAVPGFTIIQQDPIVVQYKKNDYALDQHGEWYKMGAKGTKAPLLKDIDPTLEKTLDRVAGF